MVSIIAFVINIGLFVKAKVNLQNATDSAAFAGAAVQARQLSKIAYLNWEMRNIYKEWMYKYYVIGNLNVDPAQNPGTAGTMDFRLADDVNVLDTGPNRITKDPFNIPVVCIHIAGSQTNICKRYSVPGLPEFGSSNMVGAEEASRAFMDTLISTKVNDCIDRSRLNMTVANTWTYNVLGNSMDQSLTGQGPAILSDRQGAWPKAVELAIRMRNLEYVMNRPAITNGVCNTGSTDNGLAKCGQSINAVIQERNLGNERIIKAFYSGYRNLGNDQDNELKTNFTLTELAPQGVKNDNKNNASNFLIPAPYEKQWVDLKLMMVNYAIFYAAMIPRADSKTSGACDISKVAIPVPGYPMGFYKNPDILTYYAVKGESEFLGMFNPFRSGPVKLTAYAAAKPFGGRIGPMLFLQKENQDYFLARNDSQKYRSVPYITSYDFRGAKIRNQTYAGNTKFIPGLPLPTNTNSQAGSFWLEIGKPLGGLVADASGIQFGVPNMVYDYQVPFRIDGYSNPTLKIHQIKTTDTSTETPVGLFSRNQYKKFMGPGLSATISPESLDHEIARVRAPTSYEAGNYLIPTPNDFNISEKLDSFGFISGAKEDLGNGYERYDANIYAPLYQANDQNDVLFKNAGEVQTAIFNFMRAQVSGMKKYKMALNSAAAAIYEESLDLPPGAEGSASGYAKAASGVSDITFSATTDLTQTPKSCTSLAGQFLYFYYGEMGMNQEVPADSTGCPVPLSKLFEQYFAKATTDVTYNPSYYNFKLSWPKSAPLSLLSAYSPGPFTGVGQDGTYSSPIPGARVEPDVMHRNTYSTKFISLDSLQNGGGPRWSNESFPIHSEGSTNQNNASETAQNSFRNPIDADGLDLSSIKY
jgi:hypothetical protein